MNFILCIQIYIYWCSKAENIDFRCYILEIQDDIFFLVYRVVLLFFLPVIIIIGRTRGNVRHELFEKKMKYKYLIPFYV